MAATYPTKKCASAINFGTLSGFTGTKIVAAVAFYNSATSGTFYGGGPVGTSIPINSGDGLNFAVNAVTIIFKGATGSLIGDQDGLDFLDNRYGSGSPATLYAALIITLPDGDDGSIVEFSGGTYARVAITNNATNFPAATMV